MSLRVVQLLSRPLARARAFCLRPAATGLLGPADEMDWAPLDTTRAVELPPLTGTSCNSAPAADWDSTSRSFASYQTAWVGSGTSAPMATTSSPRAALMMVPCAPAL